MKAWDRCFFDASPLFAPLRAHGAGAATPDWPTLVELQALLDARGVLSGGGVALRLIPQAERVATFEERYEVRLFLKGELQLRPQNWHDLFNVLTWVAYPRAKAALNARHYQAALTQHAQGRLNRGPAQDALTLFDEGGMIVAASDTELLQDLRDFAWKRLFWERRARVEQHMRWLVFGHALYEKALEPYIGVTGRGLLLTVEAEFLARPLAEQLAIIDERIAMVITNESRFGGTRDLTPVPVLGVPGVWPANENPAFYDNAGYFRERR